MRTSHPTYAQEDQRIASCKHSRLREALRSPYALRREPGTIEEAIKEVKPKKFKKVDMMESFNPVERFLFKFTQATLSFLFGVASLLTLRF